MDKNIGYYKPEDATKILPLIISYCKDLSLLYRNVERLVNRFNKLNKILTTDNDKNKKLEDLKWLIKTKIEMKHKRYADWKEELKELGCYVCSTKAGRVDIPCWDKFTKEIIMFCVGVNTKAESIQCHSVESDGRKLEKYWGLVSEKRVK